MKRVDLIFLKGKERNLLGKEYGSVWEAVEFCLNFAEIKDETPSFPFDADGVC